VGNLEDSQTLSHLNLQAAMGRALLGLRALTVTLPKLPEHTDPRTSVLFSDGVRVQAPRCTMRVDRRARTRTEGNMAVRSTMRNVMVYFYHTLGRKGEGLRLDEHKERKSEMDDRSLGKSVSFRWSPCFASLTLKNRDIHIRSRFSSRSHHTCHYHWIVKVVP
jgi:hypothetical protein